ncbi:MAG: DUF3466 family protein [Verrucomicrobia bacterium]|nr:DUF3466 family protein [Verrucomicrobiota bacterium]
MPSLHSRLFIYAFAFAAASLVRAQTYTYTITNLGNLGGSSSSSIAQPQAYATSINNSGQIVGSAYTASRVEHAFLYQNGAMTDLTATYGNTIGAAKSINNSGMIAGTLNNAVGSYTISAGGTVTTVGTMYVNKLNPSGLLVGSDTNYPNVAAQNSGGTTTSLGTFGGTQSSAYGINTAGTIVGYATSNGSSTFKPFVYSGGTMTNLGNLGGNGEGIAYDINDAGTIVGYSKNASGYSTAFSYVNGTITSLGQLNSGRNSVANAINASGTIVGFAVNGPSGRQEAVIFNGAGSITSLSSLVDLSSAGFSYLTQALDINDLGQIVGYGVPIGGSLSAQQAFLLTPLAPVPEPATTAAIAGVLALGTVVFFRNRRR